MAARWLRLPEKEWVSFVSQEVSPPIPTSPTLLVRHALVSLRAIPTLCKDFILRSVHLATLTHPTLFDGAGSASDDLLTVDFQGLIRHIAE